MIEETTKTLIEAGLVMSFTVTSESVKGKEWSVSYWLAGFTRQQYLMCDNGDIKTFKNSDDAIKFIHELGYDSEITVHDKDVKNTRKEEQAALSTFNAQLQQKEDFYETGNLEKIREMESALDILLSPDNNIK